MGTHASVRASFALLCLCSASTLLGCGGKTLSDGGAGVMSDPNNLGGAGGDAPDAASTTTAGGMPAKTLRDPDLNLTINSSLPGFIGLDCRNPQVEPVSTNFNLVPSNHGASTKEVTFSNAQVKFTNGSRTLTWRFQITPTDSGPVQPEGSLFVIPMWNVPNSGSGIGTGTPCDYACDQPVDFSLDVTEAELGTWTLTWMSALNCPG